MSANRASLLVIAAAALSLTQAAGGALAFDPNSREEAMQLFQRMNCGQNGTGTVYLYTKGRAYGHVDGVRDSLLFNVEVLNVRQCGPLPPTVKDGGFRLTSREVLLYRDAKTNEVLNTWLNPYTGQTVEVLHVDNDPVNGNYTTSLVMGGGVPLTIHTSDDVVIYTYEGNLFYENPLAGAYQKYVGGMYHAMEMANLYVRAKDLKALSAKANLPMHLSWSRMSNWLPWMEMGGRDGYFYVHTAGEKYASYDDVPKSIRAVVDEKYPKYRTAPPLDDTRPNETSWTFFKKTIDARAATK